MLTTDTYKPRTSDDVKVFHLNDLIPSRGDPTSVAMPSAAVQLAGLLDHLPDLEWFQVQNHFADAPRKPTRAEYEAEILKRFPRRRPRRDCPTDGQWQRDKTHCPAGHEYTEENTRINSWNGQRCCRACEYDRRVKKAARELVGR